MVALKRLLQRPVLAVVSRWNRSTLRDRFLLVMIVLTFFPVAVVGMLSFQISRSTIERNHIASYSANLAALSEVVDIVLENVRKDCRVLLGDPGIQRYLRAPSPRRYFDLAAIRAFDEVVANLTISNSDIDSVFLFDKQGRGYYYCRGNLAGTNAFGLSMEDIEGEPWYRRAVALAGKELFLGYNALAIGGARDTFSCVKLLKSIDDFRDIGLLVVNVSKRFLSRQVPRRARGADRGRYLVLDTSEARWNLVFSSAGGEVPLEALRSSFGGERTMGPSVFEQDGFLAVRHVNRTTGWSVIHLIERSELFRDTERIGTATAGISLAMIFVVAFLFAVVSEMLARPLAKLEKVIADVAAGSLNITEEFGEDEIGAIGNQFKRMVNNNLELRERLMHANLRQREAELRALQAQINPHFLYNTLDSMFWLAKVNKVESIATMALALSSLFRLTLANGGALVTVREEIDHVRNYLAIQNIRYRDRFVTDIRVEESVLPCLVLKLTLQPLVENAVIHGLEPKVGPGRIQITGTRQGDCLVFEIADDGVGMNPGDVRSGHGISNVHERIRLFYGEAFGVVLQSEVAKGTTVRVTLPCRCPPCSS